MSIIISISSAFHDKKELTLKHFSRQSDNGAMQTIPKPTLQKQHKATVHQIRHEELGWKRKSVNWTPASVGTSRRYEAHHRRPGQLFHRDSSVRKNYTGNQPARNVRFCSLKHHFVPLQAGQSQTQRFGTGP